MRSYRDTQDARSLSAFASSALGKWSFKMKNKYWIVKATDERDETVHFLTLSTETGAKLVFRAYSTDAAYQDVNWMLYNPDRVLVDWHYPLSVKKRMLGVNG